MTAKPINLAELAPVFDRLLPLPLALAVSGGPDSTALMHLVAEWARGKGGDACPAAGLPPLAVVTVNHGLRPESAAEAVFVAREAGKLGLPHATLVWHGEKPATGIQAAARAARYGLLANYLADFGRTAVVTAHTEDDVAETLLMRLARGSGADGLAAMSERGRVHSCPVLRPLLAVPKARLIETLRMRGLPWLEDPSNANPNFERPRIRAARNALQALGLANSQLALSARRLQRASAATTTAAEDLLATAADLHEGAYGSAGHAAFASAPEEVALKALRHLLRIFGGESEPARLSQIEALGAHLFAKGGDESRPAMTLGGVMVDVAAPQIRLFREPGRTGLPAAPLAPGAVTLWDNRFSMGADAAYPDTVLIAALGAKGLALVRQILPDGARLPIPAEAARTLPAFWKGEELLAVPYLSVRFPPLAGPQGPAGPLLTAHFTPSLPA